MKIDYKKILVGIYGVNCYIVYDEDSKDAIVIDPGGDADLIIDFIEKNNINLLGIFLTHGHGDHIGGVNELKKHFKVDVLASEYDKDMLLDPNLNQSSRMPIQEVSVNADNLISKNKEIKVGNLEIEIITTPGHTKGGLVFKIDNILFTGDTLFKESIGRSDLYGGDHKELIKSIKNKLLVLDENLLVMPGHGPESTIKHEKQFNSFLK